MLQDIFPESYRVEYRKVEPKENDFVLSYNEDRFLLRIEGDQLVFPRFREYKVPLSCRYLFTIGEERYFFQEGCLYPSGNEFVWMDGQIFRKHNMPKRMNFAGITALHLLRWYKSHRFCGSCGGRLVHSGKERMLFCPSCGIQTYPAIAPVVIVAVYDGDRLLMSKYKGQKDSSYILLAGFVEVGETPEEAARREVFEETGIRIRNIRYYGSQPWGYSSSLLMGFYAELDGDAAITVEEDELSEACWIPRDQIRAVYDDFSLTNEMIVRFQENNFREKGL